MNYLTILNNYRIILYKSFKYLVLVVVLLILLLMFSCSSLPIDEEHNNIELIEVQDDKPEYELIIFDIGFDSWFITRNTISMAHSNSYYQNWNYQYATEWNNRYYKGDQYFESRIDYDPHQEYDLELNYTLYNYFMYVEDKLNTQLVYRGRL